MTSSFASNFPGAGVVEDQLDGASRRGKAPRVARAGIELCAEEHERPSRKNRGRTESASGIIPGGMGASERAASTVWAVGTGPGSWCPQPRPRARAVQPIRPRFDCSGSLFDPCSAIRSAMHGSVSAVLWERRCPSFPYSDVALITLGTLREGADLSAPLAIRRSEDGSLRHPAVSLYGPDGFAPDALRNEYTSLLWELPSMFDAHGSLRQIRWSRMFGQQYHD